ncbi:MAG: hypothetical protein ACYCO3_11895 [Mycobacteriales bacterium]
MDGAPEGSREEPRRVPRGWLIFAVVFAGYLLFRIGQGVLWIAHHV